MPGGLDWALYFIDDVCVTVDPQTCYVTQGVHEREKAEILVFPDPFIDVLDLTGLGDRPVRMELRDLSGRIHAERTILPVSGTARWQTTGLATGQYLLMLYMPDGSRVTRLLHHLLF
jgi:hypothetical protein